MSKMSMLHAELSEQASALGFESIEQAEQAGYGVDYKNARLIEPQEAAHEAWVAERDALLKEADEVWAAPNQEDLLDLVSKLVQFIKRGEC